MPDCHSLLFSVFWILKECEEQESLFCVKKWKNTWTGENSWDNGDSLSELIHLGVWKKYWNRISHKILSKCWIENVHLWIACYSFFAGFYFSSFYYLLLLLKIIILIFLLSQLFDICLMCQKYSEALNYINCSHARETIQMLMYV